MQPNRGFTLLEIMIALLIFVMVMGMVVTGFNVVMRSREQLQAQSEQLEEIQLAMTLIARDITQIINRPVRTDDGVLPAMLTDNADDDFLEFTRGGLINPFGQAARSDLIRVAYHFEQGALIRKLWRVLDRAPNSKAESRVILHNIKLLEFSYLNSDNEFTEEIDSFLPRAVRVRIDLTTGQHLERLLRVSGGGL